MNFVAATETQSGLVRGGMEAALGVKLRVQFEFFTEFVTQDETGKPSVRSFAHKLVTDFVVHINGAKFLGKLKGQQEGIGRGSDPAPDGVVGIVEKELGKHRDRKPRFSGVVETPLHSGIGLP